MQQKQRGKSAGAVSRTATTDELRAACRRVAPYIVHGWRQLGEELGLPDADLARLQHRLASTNRPSDVTYEALCCWLERAGRAGGAATREKLARALHACGLRRAQDELRSASSGGRSVPFLGRPATAAPLQGGAALNRHAKQREMADRLSRPKKTSTDDQQSGSKHKKQLASTVPSGSNPLAFQFSPSKESDICEVKVKITVRGVAHTAGGELESTKDDFHSTKDDFKHTCHTFLKLVMTNQKTHFKQLQELLGFDRISLQRLEKIGFNINLYILCFNLGAFEILYQSYTSGRLKKIIQGVLVNEEYLRNLNAGSLELSVVIEEGMVNKYRDILVVRGVCSPADSHPVDVIDSPASDSSATAAHTKPAQTIQQMEFNLDQWRKQLVSETEVLQKRFKDLWDSSSELLIILRIAKRPGSSIVVCLRDVVDIFQSLRTGQTVSSDARILLIAEFLAIVNQVRLKTGYIRDHDLIISFDETLQDQACDKFHLKLSELEEMLKPDYHFETEDGLIVNALSADEKVTYGGMFAHIPRLLRKLGCICDILSYTKSPAVELMVQKNPTLSDQTTDENANITSKQDQNTQHTSKEQPTQDTGVS